MRDKWSILCALSGLICLTVIVIAAQRLAFAESQYSSTVAHRDRLAEDVVEYQLLRSRQADTLYGTQPKSDFEKRVAETLADAGIRPVPRYSMSVMADQEYHDQRGQPTGLRQQRASVQISGLRTEEIGEILTRWAQQQKLWIPEKISLVHDQRSNKGRYTLTLECVAVFHGQGSL